MGKLIYSKDTPYQYADKSGPQKTSVGVWWNEEKDSYSVITKEFVHRPRKSGAVSKYWKTEETSIYKKTKSGYCLRYRPVGRGFYSDRVLSLDYASESVKEAPGFEQWFKPCDIEQNPLWVHFDSNVFGSSYRMVDSELIPHLFRNNTMAEFVTDVFGKTRVRKDLIKAVAKSSLPSVEAMWAARGTVPVDWIVSELREKGNIVQPLPKLSLKGARWVLPRVRPQTQKNILSELLGNDRANVGYLRDISWFLRRNQNLYDFEPDLLMGREIRNIKDAHDHLFNFHRRQQVIQSNVEVKLDGFKKELHKQQIGSMKFVVASKSKMLRDWGNEMGNCIGSYDAYIRDYNTILAGIYEGDKLIANTEIKKIGGEWKVIQLLGKYNQRIPDEQKQQIEKFFTDNSINVDDYWGKK